ESARTPQVLESRSFLMWQLGRTAEALELALDAAEQGGERDHRVWAAQLAAAEDDLELALDLYRQARADNPTDRGLALAEVEILRQMDRTDEAIDFLATMPPDSDVLYTLGSYLYQAGRLEEAEAAWVELAAVEDADDPVHHAFLVAFLAELLELDEQALEWYEQVQSGPNANRAMLRRAVIEGQQGNLLAARSLLQSVRLGDERDLSRQSLIIEADLLREADQADQAVRLLTSALREQPNDVVLLYSRAICAVAMDDIDLAEQDFRRILQIEDDNAMALNALGYTLTDRTDRHQEAYRLISRAHELEPDSPSILDSMGWVYFHLGQPERALPYLEQALEGEDNPEIAAHLGEVLWHLGREAEATEILSNAVDRFPEDSYLADTRRRLGLVE
ncbi:MAG: tetratricopeptide repeat protein, partial [Wenzhouxiangella sp.]